jgi:hypothetical protein
MRIYVILILAVSFITNTLAQNPQLFEDIWYLQELTIDGTSIAPPNIMPATSESTFDETGPLFSTGYCDFMVVP